MDRQSDRRTTLLTKRTLEKAQLFHYQIRKSHCKGTTGSWKFARKQRDRVRQRNFPVARDNHQRADQEMFRPRARRSMTVGQVYVYQSFSASVIQKPPSVHPMTNIRICLICISTFLFLRPRARPRPRPRPLLYRFSDADALDLKLA